MADPSLIAGTDEPTGFDPKAWRSDLQGVMRRWMLFWWVFMPYILFAPAWDAVHQRPDEHGAWLGYGLVAAIVLPIWLYAGWIGRKFFVMLREIQTHDEIKERSTHAARVLQIRRAERLERAQVRLARLAQADIDAEQARLRADLVALAEDLSDQDGDPADN